MYGEFFDQSDGPKRVLVLNATGKAGSGVCKALVDAGFDVYGTTRQADKPLAAPGAKPVVCNYTVIGELMKALRRTGAKRMFVITDYFGAAKSNSAREIEHGISAMEAAKAVGVRHLVFMSIADAPYFDERVKHAKTKLLLESYLRSTGVPHSILRPCAFFENFTEGSSGEALLKDVVRFPTLQTMKYCATYDIGRAAALMFGNPQVWLNRTLDVISWKGALADIAAALQRVTGRTARCELAPPLIMRKFLLSELHHMFLYYEQQRGPRGEPEQFRRLVPDAMGAEDWFRTQRFCEDTRSRTG